MKLSAIVTVGFAGLAGLAVSASADTMWLKDGTVLSKCYVRDEGVRFEVWEKLADVGTTKWRVIPRSAIDPHERWYTIERDDEWNAHPNLPDLGIGHIEINPKLVSLHQHIDYDKWGRPIPKGPGIPDLGDQGYMQPEELVKGLKLRYKPGEEITMTAYVRNVGFVTAKPFDYVWLIDDRELAKGRCDKSLKELEETTIDQKWAWQDGMHSVTFRVVSGEPEISTMNNEVTDALWGWGLTFTINRGHIPWWHQRRNAYGTFSFEDFYRWQMDIMNLLFANSKYPSAPDGIKARVRIDRIIWCDDYQEGEKLRAAPDGYFYAQGLWSWGDTPDEKAGKWGPFPADWSGYGYEWSTLHELGHQLGCIDWYMFDCHPDMDPYHAWPDTNEPIPSFMCHPDNMMHSHGPSLFSEVDAAYFNMSVDKPRGYFGDYVFAIPKENFLKVVDVNGLPVADAKIEIYQRGVRLDPAGQPGEEQGVKFFPVIEDGDFGPPPVSKEPVIVGTTDANGAVRLPNRPAKEVRTLNGFERRANPFGNINVVGNRALMLVKVTKFDRPVYYWLQVYDFNVAWLRGQKDKFTTLLKTPYRSTGSPLAPAGVSATSVDDKHVKVAWQAPKVVREQQYLDRVIGYRVYRRIGPMGLNDRPWFPVATLGPEATEFTVDLTQRPEDVYYYNATNRFAVSSLGELSMESELVEAPIPAAKK